jgi:hypothetical protein
MSRRGQIFCPWRNRFRSSILQLCSFSSSVRDPKQVTPPRILIPIPAVMPPVSVPPIRSAVVTISAGSPVVSRSIVPRAVIVAGSIAGAIVRRTRDNHRNLRLGFAHCAESSGENNSQNKEELSHKQYGATFWTKGPDAYSPAS